MRRIKVVLAEDQALIREGLVRILTALPEVELSAVAVNGRDAVTRAVETSADIVLMDVAMPQLDGISATRELLRIRPSARVLILSATEDEPHILEAIKAGASGYLLKSSVNVQQLQTALETLAHGEAHFSPSIVSMMVRWLRDPGSAARDPLADLSERRQIFGGLAQGRTVKEIAHDLGVSRSTVETHRAALLAKLGLADNAAVMRFAFDSGLITPPKAGSTNS